MIKPIHVLLVEDDENDAILLIHELKKGEFDPDWKRVQSAVEMRAALEDSTWDAIISDFKLPSFSAIDALTLAKETGRDMPFILVSGTIGEETAVKLMRAGAHDYVSKEHLNRLPEALRRELDEAQVRAERRKAQEALRASEARYRMLAENMSDIVWLVDLDLNIQYLSPSIIRLRGYTLEEIHELPLEKHLTPDSLERALTAYQEFRQIVQRQPVDGLFPFTIELEFYRKDGTTFWSENTITLIRDASGQPSGLLGSGRDITQRKQVEEALQANQQMLNLQLNQLRVLHDIDLAITSYSDIYKTMDIILDKTVQTAGIDAAALFLPDGNNNTDFVLTRQSGIAEGTLQTHRLSGEDLLNCARPLGRNGVWILADESQVAPLFRQLAQQFKSCSALTLQSKGQIIGLLLILSHAAGVFNDQLQDFLDSLSLQATIAIENASLFAQMQVANQDLSIAYEATIAGWAKALELRDAETRGHSERVTQMACRLAEKFNIHGEAYLNFRRGVFLHDIGKMGIPDNILLKPGPLNEREWEVMHRHPEYAMRLLSEIPYLRPALEIPYCHHERWDGSGYPRGLRGEEIPLAARIFAVVDVWDALRSDRPYRPAWQEDDIENYLKENAGKTLDPEVVRVFLQLIKEDQMEKIEVLQSV